VVDDTGSQGTTFIMQTTRPALPRPSGTFFFVFLAFIPLVAAVSRADEGMWLFSHPPLERLEKNHAASLKGKKVSPEWLTHLQQSSVRFNSGGSGSFVSADGLVLTNHHVGADSLQKLGDAQHNYYRDGFSAATQADELKCHDLELNVLVSIEDVTPRVQAAVTAGMAVADAFAARRKVMAEIEKESVAATGLRSDVVTLHQGGLYHLYRAKKYTDVRLVFAPEQQIAFFGGDADNFEFPRYNLDICFFRAYENGSPARVPHHLTWSRQPVAAGELVFVSGHPGHTDRADTLRELLAMRDRQIPFSLATLNRLEVMLDAYSDEGPEEKRQALGDLFGVTAVILMSSLRQARVAGDHLGRVTGVFEAGSGGMAVVGALAGAALAEAAGVRSAMLAAAALSLALPMLCALSPLARARLPSGA
jgi:hypothetical protein